MKVWTQHQRLDRFSQTSANLGFCCKFLLPTYNPISNNDHYNYDNSYDYDKDNDYNNNNDNIDTLHQE